MASQLKDLGGLTLAGFEPGPLFPKLAMLGQALPALSPAAFAVSVGSAAVRTLDQQALPMTSAPARHRNRILLGKN